MQNRRGLLDIRRWPLLRKSVVGMVGIVVIAVALVSWIALSTSFGQIRSEVAARFGVAAVNKMQAVVDLLTSLVGRAQAAAADRAMVDACLASNARFAGPGAPSLSSAEAEWAAATDDASLVRSVLDRQANPLAAQLLAYTQVVGQPVEALVTDANGVALAATSRPQFYTQASLEWWQAAYNQGQGAVYLGLPSPLESLAEGWFVVAVPIYAGQGSSSVVGVVRLAMPLADFAPALTPTELGREPQALLADSTGRVIAATQGTRVGGMLDISWRSRDYLLSERFHTHEATEVDGSLVLLGHASAPYVRVNRDVAGEAIERLAWVLYVYQPMRQAYGSVLRSAAPVIALAVVLLAGAGWASYALAHGLATPIANLVTFARQVQGGNRHAVAWTYPYHEAGELADLFNRLLKEGDAAQAEVTVERRERERERARATADFRVLIALGDVIAETREVEALAKKAVALFQSSFNAYFAGVYLVDEGRRYAVLHAGTGEAGALLLGRGHRVTMGSGIEGEAISDGRVHVDAEVTSATRRSDADVLPYTRSEAVLPLRSRGEVLGGVVLESYQTGAFDEQAVTVLQAAAAQLALAIDSVRISSVAREAGERLNRVTGQVTREAWAATMGTRAGSGYEARVTGLHALDAAPPELWRSEERRAWLEDGMASEAAPGADGEVRLAFPIKARGTTIGVLDVAKLRSRGDWTRSEKDQLQALIDQLGQTLENARLYQETQSSAAEQRTVSDATRRIRETLNVDIVLQTAVRELRAILDLEAVEVRVGEAEVTP